MMKILRNWREKYRNHSVFRGRRYPAHVTPMLPSYIDPAQVLYSASKHRVKQFPLLEM